MRRTVELAAALARRRPFRIGLAVLALAGAAAGSLPLLEAPGYELGEAGALLAAVLALPAGLAAWRRERARPDASPAAAGIAAAGIVSALVAALFAGALARAAAGPCSAAGPAAGFLPLLALPSAILGTALSVALAVLAGGRRGVVALLYVAAAAASLAASLRAAYLGPAAFVFDPLLGAWPGPIYDEGLVPDLRTVLLRSAALLEGIVVLAAVEAAARARRAGLRAAAAPIAAALLAGSAAGGATRALSALALSGERADVQRALGGRRDGPRCTVIYPAERPAGHAAAILAECEFQHADLARALGIVGPPHVTAYVHRSAAEKRRLVGAAATDFTKPWLGELHVLDGPLPLPNLRHELVHAVLAASARGPLRVPARAAVLVSTGLVEGVAVALEVPASRFTVHERAGAARALGLLPDVRRLFAPTSFWSEAPARAYTAAGSFLRFVLEHHGAAVIREAYRTGDLAAATGEPIEALASEWERFLAGVSEPAGVEAAVRARLTRGSLFSRACAREVAAIEARAGRAAAEGRGAEACALFREAAARGGAAADLKAAGDVLLRAGDLDGAERAYLDAERAAPDDGPLHAALTAARGDLAWLRGGAIAPAVAAWSAALGAGAERGEARLLHAKIVAAPDRVLGPAARDLLLGTGDPAIALARVARVDHPLAAYLVGRAFAARGDAAGAVPELERAAAGALPRPIADEADLLLGGARCAGGDVRGGEAVLEALSRRASGEADRERAGEALRRCAARREAGP